MVKVELHTHTADDPVDAIPHSTLDLIDRAAALGYGALAITLHELQLDLRRFREYAADRGIVLIPGVERTIEGSHVLLVNFHGADDVRTFADLARLKSRERGLVIAPHPFFPHTTCLGRDLGRHADLFDAVELNAMYTRLVDFNRPAIRWAARHGKPVVGNCDVHRLVQLGTTSSLVDAPAEADAICEAIVAGRVQVECRPLSSFEAGRILGAMVFRFDPQVPVSDTDRACSTRAARAPSIRGWRISSSDISQT
ncbi:MAG TPA: PHP-associated domain-containing protein [Vicinamibacterales bacterium]|nr:PHP-associated domain-containing protein [Vicinamibacterales bacterium]